MSDRLAEIQRHIDTEPVTLYGLDVAELASLCIQVDEDRTWLLARVRELGADNERLQTLCDNLAKNGGKHAHEEARLRKRVAELEAQAEKDAAAAKATQDYVRLDAELSEMALNVSEMTDEEYVERYEKKWRETDDAWWVLVAAVKKE